MEDRKMTRRGIQEGQRKREQKLRVVKTGAEDKARR